MSDSFLLHETDMLKGTHFPVIAFFGEITHKEEFLQAIDTLSNGVGYGCNYVVCTFPDDVDVDSKRLVDGIEFALYSGEVAILSYQDFYWYLKKACENYLKKYGTGAEEIQSVLAKVRQRYGITE